MKFNLKAVFKSLNVRSEDTVAAANRRTRKQAGLTLIEGLSFLGVAGMVIGGALMLSNSANNGQGANQHTAELTGLRQATKQMFTGQGNYGSTTATYASTNGTLVTAAKVPNTMSASGTTITNRWSGAVAVMGNNAQFYISSASVPQDVCVTLAASAIQSGWTGLGIGGTYPGTYSTTAAITPATAATNCAAGGNLMFFTSN